MPKYLRTKNSKSNRDIRKESKQEAGVYGKAGKKQIVRGKEGERVVTKARRHQGTGLGRALRKTLTKSKYGLKPVGRGSGQSLSRVRREASIEDPKLEPAGTRTRGFRSLGKTETKVKDGKLVKETVSAGSIEDPSKRTDQSSLTKEGLKSKTRLAMESTDHASKKSKDLGFKDAPEFKQNKEKLSAYAKAKADREKRKAEGKYVPGSRTRSQEAKDAALDLAKSRYEEKYGARKGTRKLAKALIKRKKEKRRVSPKASF